MVKIGLIGCGIISSLHVEAIDNIEGAVIAAACDISEERLASVVDATGAAGYTDYKKMVEECELDLVVITLPHALHNPATCFCAEHGLDIFLEKPFGISVSDCQEMIDCCKKNGVMLWVGHPQSYSTLNQFAKKLLDSGKYGSLVSITETRTTHYFSDSRPRWFLDRNMSGGGIMINLGAHSLDKLKYFTGSKVEKICGQVHTPDGASVEDSAQAFVVMENGVSATLNLIGHTTSAEFETKLFTTQGEIVIKRTGEIVAYKIGEKEEIFSPEIEPFMQLQLEETVAAVRGDKKPAIDGEYGLDIIRAVKRLYGEEK